MARMKNVLAGLAVAGLIVLTQSSARAQASVAVKGGTTSVALSSELVTDLTSLHVSVAPDSPATVASGVASFPAVGGTVDADTALGDVLHTGGLVLSSSTTTVYLTNFLIENKTGGATLSAQVVLNGKLLGRYAVFNINGSVTTPIAPVNGSYVYLTGLSVTLSSTGASLLNTAFGVSAFTSGIPIGTATSNLIAGAL